ncbi:MAG: translation initiation factor IF-2 [Clostridium sp.]|nr:translation initiation factor IF-2 [Clostridium sp.]MDY5508512.1 translation initiation factor IF-2 [Eubacteriales bacterium]
MTKAELLNNAKRIQAAAQELLDKTSVLKTDIGNSLQAAKRHESKLISKERAAEAERREKEKAERLIEYLNSDEQRGVYVSDRDSAAGNAAAGIPTVGNAADAGTEKAPKAEAEKVQGEPRPENADRKPEKGAQKPEPPEQKPVQPAPKPEENKPEKAAEREQEQNVDKPAEHKPEKAEPVRNNVADKVADSVNDAQETKDKNNKEMPGANKETKQNSEQAAKAKNTAEKTEISAKSDSSERVAERTENAEQPKKNESPENGRNSDRSRSPQRTNDGRRGDRPSYDRNSRSDRPQGDRPSYDRNSRGDRPQGDRPSYDRNSRGDRPQGDRPPYDRNARGDRPQGERRGDNRGFGRPDDKDAQQNRQQRPQQRPVGRKPGEAPAIIQKENRAPENKSSYVRTFDTEKKAKNKKTIMKETAPSAKNWEDDGGSYGGRKKKAAKQTQYRKPEPVVIEKAVITTETITVRDFSEKIGKPAAEILKKLFMMGIVANINQDIDFETCELVAMEYDIELEHQVAKTYEETMQENAEEVDAEEDLVPRPPVVTIMGHVDHGKTSLLDAIRKTHVTEGEAGGITQHIGAYTVECNGRMITFIDTPGHEAFTSMRARGAQVTDVVILVVAADDGIMPQTVEAINHSKAAGVPIIVAVNKIDKPESNPERVKQQLTEHGLVCEDWGGDTICVPVSAKKQQNLDELLEMVLLQADVLDLKANPNKAAKGTIIEAQLDKGRGPVATVLVQNGTLKIGDPIVAGIAYGRVRAMMNDKGENVKTAGPSCPVEVLGFNEVPSAGDIMNVAEVSKKVAEERRNRIKAEQLKNLSKVSLEDLFSHIAEGEVKTLNIVVKADVHGSVEAVKQALEKLSNEEVCVKCIHGGVGAITESDVMFASASNAIVIGFNVRPDSGARNLAEQEKVDVRTYRIIYQAIEDVENAMKGMFKPVFKEVHLGTISVRNTFKVSSVGTIAGAYVQDGKVQRNAQVRVVRDGVVIHEGQIASLRRFKDDVREVAAGYECGIGIENFNDIHEGDVIEAYTMEEVKR